MATSEAVTAYNEHGEPFQTSQAVFDRLWANRCCSLDKPGKTTPPKSDKTGKTEGA